MAEAIVSPIADSLLGKLASLAYQEACLIWGVKTDLLKLEWTLKTIKAVLLDAEQQQLHNNEVRVWLEELKDVCYDAEDVFDEFEIQALRRQRMVNRGSITQKVWNYLSWPKSVAFRFTIGHKIREVREKLDEVAAVKVKFHLTSRVDDRNTRRERELTHSFVFDSEVIGRDEEEREIVELLTQSGDDDQNISIIPIVGMGGLGKTALVKSVYNNEKMDQHFDLKVWVCVSEEFVERQLMISILKSVVGQNFNDLDIDQLQRILRDTLAGKRYLLVMDDIWNENVQKWMKFKMLLLGGASGSKIVVTTRSKRVASIMSTSRDGNGYNLEGLSYESCLSLFMNCAFRAGQEKHHPNLVKIGEEIVEKCGGVPLAIKSLGCLLRSSIDENEWKNVRDNDIWNLVQNENDIFPILKLSFDHLPSHLKQCLALCSLFPKDYEFFDLELVPIWMANGLLQSHGESEEFEKIGIRYLKELEASCFFQEFLQIGYYVRFKMHDLIHDLVLSISINECSMVNSPSQVISKKVRHLSFVDVDTIREGLPSSISNISHLRTIFNPFDEMTPDQSFVDSCISSFPYLRVLDLSDSKFEVLPKKIGKLKHLRYLNLSWNLQIKKLPNSICKLQKLETLMFEGCDELKEIPRGLRYLISLRKLRLTTKQKRLPENVIGCLNSLQALEISKCENLEYLCDDIGRLKALRTLLVNECPSLLSLPCNIIYPPSLESLTIIDCEKLNLRIEMEEDDSHQNLNSTQIQLRTLSLQKLQNLEELPRWLLHANTLESLDIDECPNFTALSESLQNLKSLKALYIFDCPKLTSLPKDMHRLIALRDFRIVGCPMLSKRCKMDTGEDWPKIAHIPLIWVDGEEIKSSKY
ncbi:hypothetical protein JRO89_XS05G0255200 [Xanthoceras sorbifolium]|uniref:Disease resistance protein RGA3 n=1 Tax=Xanthoceras sorbifolium TaxID=99658 RepID=A0ABQ8I393_9ROSI|nr:hypothetical protein JRO89_XS05G0255200 [Xanthoceras sorbifolium]